MTVIILDDEPYFIEAYVEALQDADLLVRVVTTVSDFLGVLPCEPNAVVIDVMLSEGLDAGMEALREMRKALPRTPAILLTNRLDVNARPIDSHSVTLSKREVSPEDLVHLVTRVTAVGWSSAGHYR